MEIVCIKAKQMGKGGEEGKRSFEKSTAGFPSGAKVTKTPKHVMMHPINPKQS